AAVAAVHARREHLALLERPVIIDFVAHLAVGVIEPAGKRRDGMRFGQPPPGHPILRELAATGMAQPARLDLLAQDGRRDPACGGAGPRINWPGDIAPLVEADEQPLCCIFGLAERPPALLIARPRYVPRSLAMAGLAADADLGPLGGKFVVRSVVVLAHAGGVAFGAHE